MNRCAVRWTAVAGLVVVVGTLVAVAGPLDPPAGPVAPTGKTLAEVEPRIAINATNTPGDNDATPSLFKITQPGSYYLTGNITGVVGKHGIEIAASGVTLDLRGFDLAGVPAMGAFDGVSATVVSLTGIAVVNGSVRSWGDEGIDLATLVAANCRVAGVVAAGNAGNGIGVGPSGTASNCSASFNAANGISIGVGGTASNCTASNNTLNGINTVTGCSVSSCAAYLNTANGISTGNGSTVSNCSAFQNTGNGILTGNGGTVTNCSAHLNTANGITTGDGGTVTNCSAFDNTTNGIVANIGGTVADCTARSNTLDGILCANACVIRGNTCANNGDGAGDGAGVHVTGVDNRIEGNNCTGANRGIDVDGTGNIIIRNTCSGNTSNWEIAIGNSVGPIVVAGPNALPISGNGPAPSTLGSTDPNANFSY